MREERENLDDISYKSQQKSSSLETLHMRIKELDLKIMIESAKFSLMTKYSFNIKSMM